MPPDQDYIHGYSRREQQRLIAQAQILAPNVLSGLDLSGTHRLLELGCGVGAELSQIRDHWAGIELTGIDRSAGHLEAARAYLHTELRSGQARLVRADASALPFGPGAFDTVITIWMLEHIPDPRRVLAEALRVLEGDGRLIATEVDNGSFAFEPAVPAITDWWERFNRYQTEAGGAPFIGRRLAGLARDLGCRAIRTETLPIIASDREPARRAVLLDYLEDLLLSGAERLLTAGLAEHGDIPRLRSAFAEVRDNPAIGFRYFAVRLTCRRGALQQPVGPSRHRAAGPPDRIGAPTLGCRLSPSLEPRN